MGGDATNDNKQNDEVNKNDGCDKESHEMEAERENERHKLSSFLVSRIFQLKKVMQTMYE